MQHGVYGSHHNIFEANQIPYPSCDFFWKSKRSTFLNQVNLPQAWFPLNLLLTDSVMKEELSKLKVGDFISLWEGCVGLVLSSSEDYRELAHYPTSIWADLGSGYLVLTNTIGLSQYPLDDSELKYISNHFDDLRKMKSKVEYNIYLESLVKNI